MRLGSFLLGSVVGAMAASYMMRNGRQGWMSSWNSMGKLGNAMEAMNAGGSSSARSSSPSANSWDAAKDKQTIERILNQDPELKKQADEIMKSDSTSDSGGSQSPHLN